MKIKDALALALFASVTLFCLITGINWISALVIGFGASFLPIVPDMFMDGYRAGKKEWDDPKYKK